MASLSSEGVTRGGGLDGGEKRDLTSLESVEGSGSAGRGREGREAREVSGRAQRAWVSWWSWIVGLCCCRAEPTSVELKPSSVELEPSSDRSWYHSTRIQRMMEKKGEFSTTVDFEIDSSTDHWSEMDPAVSETEHSRKANREYFEVLKRRRYVREGGQLVAKQLASIDENTHYSMFRDWDGLVVGEKIAEGGQAEIYAARDGDGDKWAVKVFKAGSVLEHLEKQWPPALLKSHQFDYEDEPSLYKPSLYMVLWGATLLRDEQLLDRFAFVMERHWGDLRTLIDKKMIESCNKGPPFPSHVGIYLMNYIAFDMIDLHEQDPQILHNDLKAANVLVQGSRTNEGPFVDSNGRYMVYVSDYECSVGVVGTGIWRAPEILEQLKNNVPMTEVVITKKCDVYSFAMICYEIVSGRIPFEDYDFQEGRDRVLNGERPELPPYLNSKVKNLIMRCWDSNPLIRPSFRDIYNITLRTI